MDDNRVKNGTCYVLQAQVIFRAMRALALAEHERPGLVFPAESVADLAWAGETLLDQAFAALQEEPERAPGLIRSETFDGEGEPS